MVVSETECATSGAIKQLLGLASTETAIASRSAVAEGGNRHFGAKGCFFNGRHLFFSLDAGTGTDPDHSPICKLRVWAGS